MGYLQFNVIEHEHLIQKHAAALGIPDVKVTGVRFNGPAAMNDALLSDSVDIVGGSPNGMFTLWAKARGTPQEVRAITALVTLPYQITTNDPEIKTIADMARCKKIPVPSVKVSSPAVTVQMAAAKLYGIKEYNRFDAATVTMSPADATIALLTGSGDVNCVVALPPYLQQQLEHPNIHAIASSFDLAGGPTTYTVAYTSKRFHDRDPKLYQAVYDALIEATERVTERHPDCVALLDRGRRVETDRRFRCRCRVQPRHAMDSDPAGYDETGRVHGGGRHHQGEACIMEGLFLPRGLRSAGKLRRVGTGMPLPPPSPNRHKPVIERQHCSSNATQANRGKPSMKRRTLLAAPIALAAGRAAAADRVKIIWWHAMTAALADEVNRIATGFNASQDAVEIEAVYKGGYADTLTATIAASRAGQAPHLVQIFEVGTGTMLAAGKAVKPVWELAKETGLPIDAGSLHSRRPRLLQPERRAHGLDAVQLLDRGDVVQQGRLPQGRAGPRQGARDLAGGRARPPRRSRRRTPPRWR